ncbi:peptidoglycan DD-metalloendopeptidase family protein [Leptolyngbya sp. AN03gr2]|uniref:M23 family metallopeptidase n=1 Tax=unclassified Leptolyngbya TaxID=2650499 RepID=UPI003D321D64
MLELIPTLFAQQQVKQAVVPVQPIEQSATPTQSPAPVVTPASAIAVPESSSVSIPATPVPVAIPSPQTLTPITSNLSLPQVPQKASLPTKPVESRLVNSRSVEPQNPPVVADSNRKPAATDPKSQTVPPAATVQRTERSTQPSTATVPSQRTERSTAKSQPVTASQRTERSIPLPTPAVTRTPVATETPSVPKAETGIEIPVPKPTIQATPQNPTQEQKQRLEQRLAEIVAKDREAKQIQQRDTLIARAYSLATQRRFAQARKQLQDPSISADVRDQILSNINSLESASRTVGVTPIKEPVIKPARAAVTAKKPSTSTKPVARAPQAIRQQAIMIQVPRAPQATRQQAITIQVPRAIQSLPIQRRSPIAANSTAPSASDAGGEYIDQLVKPPSNLQAFNRNLPQTTAKGQIVYPLPEPVPVTSGFGWRRHPVTGARRFHAGVDLGAAQGTPVIASRGGKVTVADRMGGYGLTIVTQQPNGKQDTLYAHLSQIYVRPGETIQPGTIIGRVGSTGLSTGPHLHYEARQMTNSGWTAVNPGSQLEAARSRLVQARQQEERSTRSSQGG